jgi:Mor family transcriptional regulator
LEVNDILNNLITESHMQIKQRYMDEKTVPNNFNDVTITNHEDANVVSVGDARKVIIHSSAEKNGTKWFAQLGAMILKEHKEKMTFK